MSLLRNTELSPDKKPPCLPTVRVCFRVLTSVVITAAILTLAFPIGLAQDLTGQMNIHDSEEESPEIQDARKQDAGRLELEGLRRQLHREGSLDLEDEDNLIMGEAIAAAPNYRIYLAKAAKLSHELLNARSVMLSEEDTLNLQRLGALVQNFTLEHQHFTESLRPEEREYESYKLINTAVNNMQQAIEYWRTANKYRRWERGGKLDRQEDDNILQLKLQTASNAIGALAAIIKTRRVFERSLNPSE